MASKISQTVRRQAAHDIPLTLSYDGSAKDLTGYTTTDLTFYFGAPASILSTLTIGSGITIDTAASGEITVSLSSSQTDEEPGNYIIELWDLSGSNDELVLYGTLTIQPSLIALV
jgi:hypothetical protein